MLSLLGCADPRINGTLWWYSAGSTLVADSLVAVPRPARYPSLSPNTGEIDVANERDSGE